MKNPNTLPGNLAIPQDINFLLAVLNTMDALTVVLDTNGRIVGFNRACEETTGYRFDEIQGKNLFDLLIPIDQSDDVRTVFNNLTSGQVFSSYDNEWVTRNGQRRRIRWKNATLEYSNTLYVIGTGIDITEQYLIEQALKESEERYSSLFNNYHTPMLLIDPQTGSIVDVNPAACSFYGWQRDDFLQLKIMQINQLPPDRVLHEMSIAQLSNSGQVFLFQHKLANGEIRQVEVHSGPVQMNQKQYLYSIIYDITDRLQIENEIKSASRFPSENPNPVMRISREGVLLYANAASTSLLQEWNLVVGQLVPKDWPPNLINWSSIDSPQEFEIAAGDQFYNMIFTPIAGEAYFNLYGQNITHRKQVEMEREQLLDSLSALTRQHHEARQQAEHRADELSAVINAMVEGVLIYDAAGKLTRVNPAVISAYGFDPTGEDTLFAPARINQRHPDGCPVEPHELASTRALKGETVVNAPFVFYSGDREVQILATSAPIYLDTQLAGAVVVWHDITALRNAEEALIQYARDLERANQELNDFTFIVSHDLNEPLRKITVFGDLLLRKYGGSLDATARDYIERMQNASNRMQHMITDLLAYSRVNTRSEPFEPVDLSLTAEEVVSDLEGRILQTKGQVILNPLPAVKADPVQMYQLLQNLIGNGLKFHKENTPPIVRVSGQETANNWVEIKVEDNGIGFDESDNQLIFKPFFRLQGRSERQYEGSGVGLAICRKIVDRHAGEISVQSQPGAGSTFIIRLPRNL